MTPLNAHRGTTSPSALETGYETLRMAALGETALPLECRYGLALFLRQGLWGWARTVDSRSAPAALARAHLPSQTMFREHQTIIRVLAAMAIGTTTPENT